MISREKRKYSTRNLLQRRFTYLETPLTASGIEPIPPQSVAMVCPPELLHDRRYWHINKVLRLKMAPVRKRSKQIHVDQSEERCKACAVWTVRVLGS
jgi:hypothetical protein